MTNLLTRLRESADEIQRGVHSPGHVAAIMEAVKELRNLKDCRNELCLKCGLYKQRHNGACNGCRWLPEPPKEA